MNQQKVKLASWIRVDGNGNLDPSNLIQLPFGMKPAKSAGNYRQINNSVCCDEQSFILFRNTTASANITSISTADSAISWTGTLANGDYLIFEIPNSYNENFTIVTSAFSGRTLTNTTEQGDGTISTIGALAAVSNTFTTTATPGSQYLVILS